MIVACSSCPAQYSVPDAKIRGKKVRVTCKHCGTGIIVDATGEPQREELRLDVLEALAPATALASEDATRVMPKHGDRSVHDEPTVIGHMPAAALEAERRYALPTVPPPSLDDATQSPAPAPPAPIPTPTPGRALPHDVPEAELDVTNIASPQAKRANLVSQAEPLPAEAAPAEPPSAEAPPTEPLPADAAVSESAAVEARETGALPAQVPTAREPRRSLAAGAPAPGSMAPPAPASSSSSALPLQPAVELKTLLSRAEPAPAPLGAARTLYWLVAGLVVLLLALVFMRTMR